VMELWFHTTPSQGVHASAAQTLGKKNATNYIELKTHECQEYNEHYKEKSTKITEWELQKCLHT
jgi:glutamine synthetase